MIGVYIMAFTDVFAEVVQLDRRQARLYGLIIFWRTPASGARTHLQLPMIPAYREHPLNRMVHHGLMQQGGSGCPF